MKQPQPTSRRNTEDDAFEWWPGQSRDTCCGWHGHIGALQRKERKYCNTLVLRVCVPVVYRNCSSLFSLSLACVLLLCVVIFSYVWHCSSQYSLRYSAQEESIRTHTFAWWWRAGPVHDVCSTPMTNTMEASQVWRQSCTSKPRRTWRRRPSRNPMRCISFENMLWSHDIHPWLRSLHDLQGRIKQDHRKQGGSSWRISVSLCPARRIGFSGVGSSRPRSWSQMSTLTLATKRSPSKRSRSSSTPFCWVAQRMMLCAVVRGLGRRTSTWGSQKILIINLSTKDFEDNFELITREIKHKEDPDEIMGFVERICTCLAPNGTPWR